MKYWGYLAAKVVVWLAILTAIERAIAWSFPPVNFYLRGPIPVVRYLDYQFIMLAFGLFAVGLAWLIVWDQRYRCRTCLRRLRMPIQTGSWTHVLLGAPRTEYICPYGHGTLKVAELQIAGHEEPDWQPHEDMWKELLSLDETKK
jgi:hypothetical protein